MKSKRVILDTNLWISFLISRKLDAIDSLIKGHKVVLLFSDSLLEEFITVSKRPKLKKLFSPSHVSQLLSLFDLYGKLIEVKSDLKLCRDEKDNFLLNLAVDGKADYLISGDEDLLVLEKVKQTSIITFSTFIQKMKK